MTATEFLDELDAALAKATPGPWFAWNRGVGWHIATEDPNGVDHLPGRPELLPEGMRTDLARAEDAALIVAAVNALPKLTAALRAVEAVLDALDETSAECEADDFRPIIDARVVASQFRAVLADALAGDS